MRAMYEINNVQVHRRKARQSDNFSIWSNCWWVKPNVAALSYVRTKFRNQWQFIFKLEIVVQYCVFNNKKQFLKWFKYIYFICVLTSLFVCVYAIMSKRDIRKSASTSFQVYRHVNSSGSDTSTSSSSSYYSDSPLKRLVIVQFMNKYLNLCWNNIVKIIKKYGQYIYVKYGYIFFFILSEYYHVYTYTYY